MQTVDILHDYLRKKWDAGELHRGQRLPTYHQLARQCDVSYSTVHAAMRQLACDGYLRIVNGVGSFWQLADVLPVRLRFHFELITPESLLALLKKHLGDHWSDYDFSPLPFLAPETDPGGNAVITLGGANVRQPIADFSDLLPGAVPGAPLPLAFCVYQMGANPDVFDRAGMAVPESTGDFRWWRDFVDRCRRTGQRPGSVAWNSYDPTAFYSLGGLIAALGCGKCDLRVAGPRLLELLADCDFYNDDLVTPPPESFFHGGAGVDFTVGSWIAVQNHSPLRPDIRIDRLKMVPFSVGNQRCLPSSGVFLHPILPERFPVADRERISTVLKTMLSPKFRRDFCDVTGFIAADTSWEPDSYAWYAPEWAGFFPAPGDRLTDITALFSPETTPALTAAVELWKSGGADAPAVLALLGAKQHRRPGENQFKHFNPIKGEK